MFKETLAQIRLESKTKKNMYFNFKNVKLFPLLLLVLILFMSYHCKRDTPLQDNEEIPKCIQQKIADQQTKCLKKVVFYHFKDKNVYLFNRQECPDAYYFLYDKNCKKICAPKGGISGKGDGKCPDFQTKATKKGTVWSKN